MLEIGLRLATLRQEAGAAPPPGTVAIAVSHQAVYALEARMAVQHQAPYALRLGATHATSYALRVGALHAAAYALADRDFLAARHVSGYSLLDGLRYQPIENYAELVHAGRVVRTGEITLSCDESSPFWIASIEIESLEEFARLGIGDAIALTLGIETFSLVIDGRTLSRESPERQPCRIAASSPLVRQGAPFAAAVDYAIGLAMSAQAAVELFIGAVDWRLPDWVIPAGQLAFSGVTPLQAARTVVEAIGGLIESNPDGTVVCRPRHPVSVPDYATAAADHALFDSDVLALDMRMAPVDGFNRVSVANEHPVDADAAASADRLEYVGLDSISGTIRAYPTPPRAVDLVPGDAATLVEALGTVERQVDEVVEFVAGRARTQYPVTRIVSASWQAADLGTVTADGAALSSAAPGYSLLALSYIVTSVNWRVTRDANVSVQFILEDA